MLGLLILLFYYWAKDNMIVSPKADKKEGFVEDMSYTPKASLGKVPPVGNDVSGAFISNTSTMPSSIVNKSNATILCFILGICIILYFVSSIFSRRENADNPSGLIFSRTVDILILITLIIGLIYWYTVLSKEDQSNLFGYLLRWTKEFFDSPMAFVESIIFTLVFFAIVYIFRIPMDPEIKPVFVALIEHKIWILFVMFIFVFFFKYVLNIKILDLLYNTSTMQYLMNLPTHGTDHKSGVPPGTTSGSTSGSTSSSTSGSTSGTTSGSSSGSSSGSTSGSTSGTTSGSGSGSTPPSSSSDTYFINVYTYIVSFFYDTKSSSPDALATPTQASGSTVDSVSETGFGKHTTGSTINSPKRTDMLATPTQASGSTVDSASETGFGKYATRSPTNSPMDNYDEYSIRHTKNTLKIIRDARQKATPATESVFSQRINSTPITAPISGLIIEKKGEPTITTTPASCLEQYNLPGSPEVFNIGNNIYNYKEADEVCKAYGARLATYDEIENSYNNGAEWCNYGWSSDQMAYFPTQKSTWNELQKDDRLKNACGRPGVNGGYMANPNIRFGANCFGSKPKNDKWVKPSFPKLAAPDKLQPSCSKKEQEMNDRAKSLRNSAQINPISRDKWSRF
jgi:uncharacterized membrane protein YgcG